MSQRLLVFLTGLLVLTALGSYVYYRRTVARIPVDPWTLVPDDAAVVVVTRDHPTLVRHLKETQLWDNLTAIRYFQQVEDQLTMADSLAGGRSVVLRFLGRKRVLTSLHVTGPGRFDVLFQVPIGSVREYRQVRSVVEGLGRDARFRVQTRTFQGHLFTQVRPRDGAAEGLTMFNYRNHLLLSANAELLEAVVHRLDNPDRPTVAAEFQSTDYFQLKDVDATVLVNQRRLPQLLGVFFRQELGPELTAVASLARNELTQMRLAGNKVVFNGFANPETARDGLHQRLRGQPAQRLRMAEVLPLSTALLVHVGLGPAAALRSPRPALAPDSLASEAVSLLDSLTASFSQEVALCYLATTTARQRPGKLAVAYCPHPARTGQLLGQLRRATGTSPAFGRVGPYQLYQAGVAELPQRLLGPIFQGFAAPVVAQAGSYVAFADNEATARQWLQQVVAGKVWSRSPTQVAFLQDTQPLARLRVVLDMRNCWNLLLRGLQEERRAGLLRNEALFTRFPQVALQWVPAENEQEPDAQYFTQFVLRHPVVGPAVAQLQNQNGTGSVLSFKVPLRTSPALLAVSGARLPGVLVQDTAHVLHYVTPDNVVAWSDTLPGPLVGAPYRLPGGTGFLLATPGQLFQYNGRGQLQPNFPLNLPDTVRATSMSVSPEVGRARRLLVAGASSNLFLYDTQGRAYAGWQPKQLEFRLAAPPQYLSIAGRDVVLVLLENGYVYAYTQAGAVYPGFPISVGARLGSSAVVEASTTLTRTRLTVVTQRGELVSFNLSGDIVARRRVATWSRASSFRLVPEQQQQQRRFVVVREEGGRLTLFDASGRQLLRQSFVTSAPKSVQFFDFGGGRQLYSITENGPGKVYLYDARLRLIGSQPFDSTTPEVGLTFDPATTTYHLFRVIGQELRRTDLKIGE